MSKNFFGSESSTENFPLMPANLPSLIALLTKNVPESCRPAVANAVFPALGTLVSDVRFDLIDGSQDKEPNFMCVLMAKQSSGKSAVNAPIRFILDRINQRDKVNRLREKEWLAAVNSCSSRHAKPERPDDLVIQILSDDMTNAAFVRRLADARGRYIYTKMDELELLNNLRTSGTKDVGKIIRLAFDNAEYGQERVSFNAVTDRVPVRWNWNASATIQKGMEFFHSRLVDGTLSRINLCTIVRERGTEFRYLPYDQSFADSLKPFLDNLESTHGHLQCDEAFRMAERLQRKCMDISYQCDDPVIEELASRAVTIAHMKAIVLYIANGCRWDESIDQFCEWSLDYDLACKNHFFGRLISIEQSKEVISIHRGPVNLLAYLPANFTKQDLVNLRLKVGMPEDCGSILRVWMSRKYISYNEATGFYTQLRNCA
ncbi:MAG: hypothetical protein MJ001_09340 [Paludibacteraceae bacterium]|nr:hypothetical protein [Paludibacteraceae bacterium]